MPLGAEWAKRKGIDLPLPFGVSTFFTYMGRGIDITDVTVEFGGNEPQSISEFSSFAVKNQTYVSAIKFDAWVLPVVNVYALVGYASTTANMNVDITVDRPLSPLPPAKLNISTATKVNGLYSGIGTTLVGGYKSWFMLADANYGKTWPDLINNSIDFTLLSIRSGLSGKLGGNGTIRGLSANPC